MIGVMSMLLVLPVTPYGNTSSNYKAPVFEKAFWNAEPTTPKLIELPDRSLIEEALQLFSDSRDFTESEAERYEATLDRLFKPTGENFFDL